MLIDGDLLYNTVEKRVAFFYRRTFFEVNAHRLMSIRRILRDLDSSNKFNRQVLVVLLPKNEWLSQDLSRLGVPSVAFETKEALLSWIESNFVSRFYTDNVDDFGSVRESDYFSADVFSRIQKDPFL